MNDLKHRHRKKSSAQNAILIVIILLLAASLGFLVFKVQKDADNEHIEKAGTSENADHSSEYITYNGENYPVIRNMTSVLLIGTDNFADDVARFRSKNEEVYNYNRNLSDFLVILIFDHDRKTVTPFQINRDTMCDVSWLGMNGAVGGYVFEHITFSHMYGSGKEDSCENTVRTVRRFLHNAPIDHYLAFTMDAVPIVNDLVGGVTVTLDEDLPALGEEYVKGAQITLKGQNALRFVRYRPMEAGSNWGRMGRHRLYLDAFTEAALTALDKNQDLVIDVFKAIDRFLVTDLTVNNISDIVSDISEYEILPAVTPSGEYRAGEIYYEFYVDEESLWSCIHSAFCRKA